MGGGVGALLIEKIVAIALSAARYTWSATCMLACTRSAVGNGFSVIINVA